MECMEAKALKSRELREQGLKSNQQALLDDLMCLNGANGVPGDDFSVDCFLDFSAGEFENGGSFEEEEDKDSSSDSSHENNSNSAVQSSESLLADELAVPVDDVAGLEWVSQIVDDSVPEFPQFYSFTKPKPDTRPVLVNPRCFLLRAPAKARTKRQRLSRRDWSVISFLWTESTSPGHSEPPKKKPRKKAAVQTDGSQGGTAVQRRCSHCQVQKTPQWRTGPHGAKTLCNACGVRFKSGRLFPEYRPACSPTFAGDVHSNSHRKVLEIRKKKEKEVAGKETGLNPV